MSETHWSKAVLGAAARIELLVLDVDGVMTDGRLVYDADGREAKVFNVRDGYGIKALQAAGVRVAVISGRKSRPVSVRMAELGIEQVILGRDDKLAALEELIAQLGIASLTQFAYVGDDLPDLPAIEAAGLGLTVADGRAELRTAAAGITQCRGGQGAVREVCDLLLAARQ